MELHWGHAMQFLLESSCVIEGYVVFNGIGQFFLGCKLFQIIHFGFQYSPKTFHRAVIDTFANSGHTLPHPGIHQLAAKGFAGVLESPVAMKQRVSIRV